MIEILDGKLTVRESQRFIGFAGDNLISKIEFIVKNRTNPKDIYRLYLTFDNGSVNHFQLPATVTSEGTLLTWDVKEEHIFKSGIVYVQIKAFSQNGVVFHTNKDVFVVGETTEYSEYFEKNNTEFLEYEKKLNALRDYIEEARIHTPYIGENGNWFVFDSTKGSYVDTGKPSVGESLTADIADGAVTTEKISEGAVTPNELDRLYVEYLGIPSVKSYAELDGYITSADDLENYKTLYRFGFDSSFPKYGLLGDSVYLGYIADYFENETPKLILINSETFEKWSYVRNSAEVIKIESDDALSQDFIYAGSFENVNEILSYSFEDNKMYLLKCNSDSKKGLAGNTYIAQRVYETAIFDDYVLILIPAIPNGTKITMNLETGDCVTQNDVDQTYKPESEKAQSGKAVAEALETRWERQEYRVIRYNDLDDIFKSGAEKIEMFVVELTHDDPEDTLSADLPTELVNTKFIAYIDGDNDETMNLMSIKSGEWFQYTFNSHKIKRINTPVINLGAINSISELADKELEYGQTYIIRGTGALTPIGESFIGTYYYGEIDGDWCNYLKVISLEDGRTYRINLNTNDIVETTHKRIDQTYNPDSENAQSGKAVAEAISEVLGDVEMLLTRI